LIGAELTDMIVMNQLQRQAAQATGLKMNRQALAVDSLESESCIDPALPPRFLAF
jgi:hypothetical protein